MEISVYSRPPELVSKKIRKLMKDIKKVFGKNRASESPIPHLTIRSSFKVSKKDFPKVCKILKEEFKKIEKPIIKIDGWDIAPKSTNVYGFHLCIKKNKELIKVHSELEGLLPKYKKTYKIVNFDPHISLAWNMKKDMEEENYKATLNFLKKFKFKEQYIFDKLYIHERIGEDRYKLIKIIK
tara:strand:- start:107 stop:652 length:546 start_codon:yes stop_codon:yes gene_type:complete